VPIFRVQRWPNGLWALPVTYWVNVEGKDELDAAQRLMKIPLQREARHDMYVRAFVRRKDIPGRPSTKIYAAQNA
jgi:hypothetical protein